MYYENKDYKPCFRVVKRMRLVAFLSEHNFHFIKTEPDRDDESKVVWVYMWSPELQDCIESYYSTGYFADKQN